MDQDDDEQQLPQQEEEEVDLPPINPDMICLICKKAPIEFAAW
jgi:hypothetical protein